MALVTFMSDFGTEDHYVAAVKAAVLKSNPSINIVDISHNINPSDVGHGAHVLKNVYKDFPAGTVHLCALDITSSKEPSKLVALKLDEHYFVGPDSGLFSLLSSNRPTASVLLNELNPVKTTFEAKDVLAPIAAGLASGKNIHELGPAVTELKVLYGRQLKATKREIVGNVVRVDHYGNLITNILKSEFNTIMKINGEGTSYEITFGRERSTEFHDSFSNVESGECFILFNSSGVLQIGINKGNASELLGLGMDTPVIITFRP